MGALHRLNEDSLCGDKKTEPVGNLYDYMEILKTVTRKYSIPFLDMLQVGGITPKVPIYKELYMPDGLHPNDAGHEKIAARLKGFLQSLQDLDGCGSLGKFEHFIEIIRENSYDYITDKKTIL